MDKNKIKLNDQNLVVHDTLKQDSDYLRYVTATKFSEEILYILTKKRIKFPKKFLADSMGVTRSSISQYLNNEGNLTLKTMVKIAHASGYRIKIELEPIIPLRVKR